MKIIREFRALGWFLVPLALCACNGGGDSNAAAAPQAMSQAPGPSVQSASRTNAAPHISGTPATSVDVGQFFSFQPSATDADGDRLAFSIRGKPAWASFDAATGRLWGTPANGDADSASSVAISVSDGKGADTLPAFMVRVVTVRKAHYGHYFSTHYSDTPADAVALCEQPGVTGVVWRQTWNEVESAPGVYNFSAFDKVLSGIAASKKPNCQMWLFIEFKSFPNSPTRNPCPNYLQARHSGPNAFGHGAATCFMWEPQVVAAYSAMMKAAAARYDRNPRIEGLIIQESSLGFNGQYSQDVADGGTYTPRAWRDALVTIIDQCASSFAHSRCMAFLNFLRGGQSYLQDISAAIASVPNNQVCFSGPDLLPNEASLYNGTDQVYPVLNRHPGCRANSAQNSSYHVPGCSMDCIFHFAVAGTFGHFPTSAPLRGGGGLCINSYLLWNNRGARGPRGQDWTDVLPLIKQHPYGPGWNKECVGTDGEP